MKTLTGKNKLPIPFGHDDAKNYHGFLGRSADNTFFGVELEYELKINEGCSYIDGDFQNNKQVRRHINKINRTVGKCGIIKDDGSLEYGIEIASAPASYARHKNIWNDLFSNLKDFKLQSKSSCGMHVHVSRKNLTQEEIESLIAFFKVQENRVFLEKVAGRKQNQYCNYQSTVYKYCAVNTAPADTIEFRIFKSPKNKDEFLIRLQLIRSLTLWVRGRKNLTLKSFRKFISKGQIFKQLNEFVLKKEI